MKFVVNLCVCVYIYIYIYRVSIQTLFDFKNLKHQNLLKYINKFGGITYINSRHFVFFSQAESLCTPPTTKVKLYEIMQSQPPMCKNIPVKLQSLHV